MYCNVKGGYLSNVNARLILGLGQIEWVVLFFGVHHSCMECMVAFFLALCALGTWEVAADNDEWRWCRIYEGRAVTANGGKAGLDGMNGEWWGFWGKLTDFREVFAWLWRREVEIFFFELLVRQR